MKAICVIPARMGSSRFPGKPLAKIHGISMIEHIYHRCMMCSSLDAVYIATCDQEIYQETEDFGGKAIMTSPDHQRACDRTAEAIQDLDCDIVVMVQGDEPMTFPEMIDLAISPFEEDRQVVCSNLVSLIKTRDEFTDPNTIKVVMDRNGSALYFSREPIPTQKMFSFEEIPAYKQVCIIPFRREYLLEFIQLEPTSLEIAESIDMMRILEHGESVELVMSEFDTYAVDTLEDLVLVERLMENDPLMPRYLKS